LNWNDNQGGGRGVTVPFGGKKGAKRIEDDQAGGEEEKKKRKGPQSQRESGCLYRRGGGRGRCQKGGGGEKGCRKLEMEGIGKNFTLARVESPLSEGKRKEGKAMVPVPREKKRKRGTLDHKKSSQGLGLFGGEGGKGEGGEKGSA